MKKLSMNFPSHVDVIQVCCDGIIKNINLKKRLEGAKIIMSNSFIDYNNKAVLQELYSIEGYSKSKNIDPTVISNLLHSELTYIYTTFFAKRGKPGRKIYDKIMVNAKGICPYCGISSPIELDHYLPKSKFPQFSILPLNLVPSCERCNKYGKGTIFAENKGGQILHPYLDHNLYYDSSWMSANLENNGADDITVNYYTDPPDSWDSVQKDRVKTHFCTFNLQQRYSTSAGEELSTLLPQIYSMKCKGYDTNDVCEVLLDPVIQAPNMSKNHWKKVMYIAVRNYIQAQRTLDVFI